MNRKIIVLTDDEIKLCKEFSERSAKSQQAIEFGQSDTKKRAFAEIARDNLIGKMAEVAFARMLKEDFGIDIPLDFEIYERGKWDDNDMVINGWNVDIKSTRIGHWLLIEWSKLNFRQKQGELPHAFFMCKTEWDMENDVPKGGVELVGSVSLFRLREGQPNVHVIRKGEVLPGTKTHLQADNFGIEFKNLKHDWKEIITYMLDNSPPDLSSYPNPYTGMAIPQYKESKKEHDFVVRRGAQTTAVKNIIEIEVPDKFVEIAKKKDKESFFSKLKKILGIK